MKILIISYYGLRESLYGATKGLIEHGHTVIDYPWLAKRGADFFSYICQEKPDMILFWSFAISVEQLINLRDSFPELLLGLFNWDDPYYWQVAENRMTEKAKCLDMVFTTCEETISNYLSCGVKFAMFVPPGFDPDVQKRVPKSFDCDISLVATQLYPLEEFPNQIVSRKKLIDDIIKDGTITFRIYGPEKFKSQYPEHYCGYVKWCDVHTVFNSSFLNICTHIIADKYKYVNERAILVSGSGGLLFLDKTKGMTEIFNENECVFIDPDNYIQQIKHILNHKEEYLKIAENGYQRSSNNYSWFHWASKVHQSLQFFDQIDNDNYVLINNLSKLNKKDAFLHYITLGKQLGYLFPKKRLNIIIPKEKESQKEEEDLTELKLKYHYHKAKKTKKTKHINKCLHTMATLSKQDPKSLIKNSGMFGL